MEELNIPGVIRAEDLYVPALRKLVSDMILGALDRAIHGDAREILWLASDDAARYYDDLGLDRNKILVNFLRLYLKYKNRSKSWNKFKVQERKKVYREIKREHSAVSPMPSGDVYKE